MFRWVAFILLSVGNGYISRKALREPGTHLFYRFFAWEFILALFFLNLGVWFRAPFSWYQIVSWLLLVASLIPLAFGVYSLVSKGRPMKHREGDARRPTFEGTTALVTTGIYRYIRHPLYSSLLLLAWGLFFKDPAWLGAVLVLLATLFIFAMAKADEAESLKTFGPAYAAYMERTKRFVPFLF